MGIACTHYYASFEVNSFVYLLSSRVSKLSSLCHSSVGLDGLTQRTRSTYAVIRDARKQSIMQRLRMPLLEHSHSQA